MMGLGVKQRAEYEKCVLCMCVCVNFFFGGGSSGFAFSGDPSAKLGEQLSVVSRLSAKYGAKT